MSLVVPMMTISESCFPCLSDFLCSILPAYVNLKCEPRYVRNWCLHKESIICVYTYCYSRRTHNDINPTPAIVSLLMMPEQIVGQEITHYRSEKGRPPDRSKFSIYDLPVHDCSKNLDVWNLPWLDSYDIL